MKNLEPRKISFILGLAVVIAAVSAPATAAPDAAGPRALEPRAASVAQKGRSLVLALRTSAPVNLDRLPRFPDFDNNHWPYLCFAVRPATGGLERRLCLGGSRGKGAGQGRTVGLTLLRQDGSPGARRQEITARIKRPSPNALVVTVPTERANLPAHRYHWRLIARRGGSACRPRNAARDCFRTVPADGVRELRIEPLTRVGCTAAGTQGAVRHGPRGGKRVALTFDDGPGTLTPAFLDVLKRAKVPATFYVIGQNVTYYPATARRIVDEGHEIANHSWKHDLFPGYGDLSQTSRTIRSVTGFTPCTFRPPGGAYNGSVVSAARSAGRMPTVLWDVDTLDWRLPGSGSIANTVLNQARPGSIVLMHDGGGPRGQTLAAVPRIVRGLRSRGYRFTTVAELLGGSFRYAPRP